MTDILARNAPQTDAEMEAELAQMWAELETLNERMRRDQVDIIRLKNETDALKAESAEGPIGTARFWTEMQNLDAQRSQLRKQTRAVLDSIREAVTRC